jgi:uncharacterized LabA/DUF88 family protein
MNSTQRYMFFIDGTNFLIELGKELDLEIRAEKPPLTSFKFAEMIVNNISRHLNFDYIIRRYWFGSYQGDDSYGKLLRQTLKSHNFDPVIIKKRHGREKGVDISLTKEMLVNAFNNNFDVAFLIAGDEDYLTLVHEVKRYGAKIFGAFFDHGLSEELQISFDNFRIISKEEIIKRNWGEIRLAIENEISNKKDK